jgi:hypothetical protein
MNAKHIAIDDVSSGSKRIPFFNTIKYIIAFKRPGAGDVRSCADTVARALSGASLSDSCLPIEGWKIRPDPQNTSRRGW